MMPPKFSKAKAEQAAIKMAIYGPAGSGKTLTSLLIAEGLVALKKGGRVGMIDTEHGTDFYCQPVPERAVHPDAFDFDTIHTRSLMDVIAACKDTNPDAHPVVIIDSISHLWDAARAAYTGRTNKAGAIPMHAWGAIKAPYKALMHWVLNSPQHVIICGRQGNDWAEDDSGELVNQGFKMRAEGETAYEPHVLLRLECVKPSKRAGGTTRHVCHVEKDRTGKLQGRVIESPSFDSIARPLLGLLGSKQAVIESEEDASARDAEAIDKQMRERQAISREETKKIRAQLQACKDLKDLAEMPPRIELAKGKILPDDLASLRSDYIIARDRAATTEPVVSRQPALTGTQDGPYGEGH